ncbi:MAG TPA: sulfatase-like hydrolase/transferase, partial [Candidatus Methanoperedens sp.]|nr:sulfatase-like hydrolase/transferase [Candidatus Methanoperedens sp.]
ASAGGSGGPWNFILVQFESFRGRDAGFLNPGLRPSPTPFLDSLAAGPNGAAWSSAFSFGMPTINGILALQCSLAPHSRLHPLPTFPQLGLLAFPEVLRASGWAAEVFTGSDPDWDGQRRWLERWYDRLWFDKWALGDDRTIVRGALPRLRELGGAGKPFLATLTTISNHYPFDSPEPAFSGPRERAAAQLTHDSVRFTDDVLRELVTALAAEPWFARTILVVTGDHGYNLGEHDRQPGQRNGYDESLRVPLLIVGNHPGLRRGLHGEPASLLDVAPTILALAGLDAVTPWQGRSLLLPPDPERTVSGAFEGVRFAARGRRFAVRNGPGRAVELFDLVADPEQRVDLAAAEPGAAAALVRVAEERRALTDYLIEKDLIWPAGR